MQAANNGGDLAMGEQQQAAKRQKVDSASPAALDLEEPTEAEKKAQFDRVYKEYYDHYIETGLNKKQAETSARAGVDAYKEQCKKQFEERLRLAGVKR